MLNINNRIFVKSDKEFTNTLFQPVGGKTASGYYKKVKNGVKLFDAQKNIFAFVVDNKFNEQFFVSATKQADGKIWYSQGLNNNDVEKLGLTELGYTQESKLASDVINQLKGGL